MAAAVGHRNAAVNQLSDFPGHESGLAGMGIRGFLSLFGARPVNQIQRGLGHLALVLQGAAAEPGAVVIHQLAQFLGHDVFKHGVGCVQNFMPGTEIFLEQNSLGIAILLRRMIVREFHIFPGENGGVCQTESVNGLFHVTHAEQIGAVPGNAPENQLLHCVHVLIFVHHNLRVFGANLQRQLCGSAVRIGQQLGGKMLQIAVIHHVPPPFFRGKCLVKVQSQLQ